MNGTARKVAIITGGASGIGRAVGQVLAGQGWHAVLADLNGPGAESTAAAIRATGGSATGVRLDVTDADGVRRLVEETASTHQRVDLMFNNAGIAICGEVRDYEAKDWERILDVNLWGVIHGVNAAYPLMIRQGFGQIANTASMAGLIPSPGITAYAMTKHAVVGLSVSLRAEAAAYGVKVNAVCPGFVATGIYEAGEYRSISKENSMKQIPFQPRPVDPIARDIVRGLERNKPVVVVTGHGRVGHAIFRIWPGLVHWFSAKEASKRAGMRGKA